MASNKNQHFVPRCYLRPFTVDGTDGAAINLYNIDRQRFIKGAPVKHQCSGDYFYGQDPQLEKAIQLIETSYADAHRAVQAPGYVLTDLHRTQLRLFWQLQHLRTEAASIRAAQMAESMRDTAGVKDDEFRLEIRGAVQVAMKAFAESMRILNDMKVCLVKNRTDTPFFASDDPAVLTNRWYLEMPATNRRSFGLGSAGDILLLPLSPRLMFVGYDGDVYSLPNEGGWVEVRRDADVEAFNEHQFLNCRANIFVQDSAHAGVVHDSFLRVAPSRPDKRHQIQFAVKDGEEDGYTRYRVIKPAERQEHQEGMIHCQVIHAKPASWPRLIAWRPKGFAFENGSAVGFVRRSVTEEHLDREPFRKVKVR
jgi:hypothetical protein